MGYVYFFKHKQVDAVKIGMTKNDDINVRFNQFRTYSPFGAEILGVIKTAYPAQIESKLHKHYEHFRLRGEFFDISQAQIDSSLDINGLDSRLKHSISSRSEEAKEEILNYINSLPKTGKPPVFRLPEQPPKGEDY